MLEIGEIRNASGGGPSPVAIFRESPISRFNRRWYDSRRCAHVCQYECQLRKRSGHFIGR
jgi:hypothetical protein